MCGILFSFTPADSEQDHDKESKYGISGVDDDGWNSLLELIRQRGPDGLDTVSLEEEQGHKLSFSASVLSLRGDHVTPQPLVKRDDHGVLQNVLCWNGEVWRLRGRELEREENDGETIFQELVKCSGNVHDVIQSVEGPFAFVFYDRAAGKLWFGRDWLGRRSLLKCGSTSTSGGPTKGFLLSSASQDGECGGWEEVEADGIYCLDLGAPAPPRSTGSSRISRVPFVKDADASQPTGDLKMNYPLPPLNKSVSGTPQLLSPSSNSVQKLYHLLLESLRLRVTKIPFRSVDQQSGTAEPQASCKIGILFSGGLDCTVLARLAHELLPENEPVELLNVAFENRRVVAAAAKAQTPKTSRRKPSPQQAHSEQAPVQAADTARTVESPYEICPDRITGRNSWLELQRVCPRRDWRFVEINVPYEEVLAHRDKVLSLIYPHNTEMDLSIGLAFYFAARPVPGAATWPRVLLSGLGADELFGGYARHGTAFHHRGFVGLAEELEMDLNRLGKRNLGRDDRVIAHWGREARFPYLDERLLQEVVTWRADEKCGFSPPESEKRAEEPWSNLGGEKSVLRLLAWRLGLTGAAAEKKRAIQFGSRTAKMEASNGSGRVRGTQKVQSYTSA